MQTGKSRLHNVNDLAEQASAHGAKHVLKLIVSVVPVAVPFDQIGGARRDRTDDLMLAKHALSQLSYGPVVLSARCASFAR